MKGFKVKTDTHVHTAKQTSRVHRSQFHRRVKAKWIDFFLLSQSAGDLFIIWEAGPDETVLQLYVKGEILCLRRHKRGLLRLLPPA